MDYEECGDKFGDTSRETQDLGPVIRYFLIKNEDHWKGRYVVYGGGPHDPSGLGPGMAVLEGLERGQSDIFFETVDVKCLIRPFLKDAFVVTAQPAEWPK